jgi:hypothetical protein
LAGVDFTAQLTETLAVQPGFGCNWYNYFDSGPGSYSALLNRIDYRVFVDGRYQARENLVGIVGYQFGYSDYLSSDPLNSVPGSLLGKDRTYSAHYFYVGTDYEMTSRIRIAGRLGAEYTDFKVLEDSNGWSPYADIQGTYTYQPGSYFQAGLRAMQYATDVSVSSGTQATAQNTTGNQQFLAFYGGVTHKITPRITGSLVGQYQLSVFNGGDFDGTTENMFLLGINAEYRIDQTWSVMAAYNWDHLDSELDRDYYRNRCYLGVTARF